MFLLSLSQTEEPLTFVHIEFDILATEFITVARTVILGFATVSQTQIILVRTVTYLF